MNSGVPENRLSNRQLTEQKRNPMYCDKMLRLRALYRTAALLALITIFYNMLEGIVSVWLGAGLAGN